MKQLKVLVKWNWWLSFTCVCTIFLKFAIYFLSFPWKIDFGVISGNYLYLCQKAVKYLKLFWYPQNHEIARFVNGFCLKTFWRIRWIIFKFCWRHKGKHEIRVLNIFQPWVSFIVVRFLLLRFNIRLSFLTWNSLLHYWKTLLLKFYTKRSCVSCVAFVKKINKPLNYVACLNAC